MTGPRTYVEPQIRESDGRYYLTVRITTSSSPDAWTSQEALLEATTREEAHAEARRQCTTLLEAFR